MIIDSAPTQTLRMPGKMRRAEGIAFSTTGDVIAVATADGNSVFLFRRCGSGFESAPYCTVEGRDSGLSYPHDVSFARMAGDEFLAVAQRMGSITLYRRNASDGMFASKPTFEIRGAQARLKFSDGVAFVPPGNRYLAACNLGSATISFYRRRLTAGFAFEDTPCLELRHRSLAHPDGLAFTACGRWLAVANHGENSITVFARQHPLRCGGRLVYGPEPQVVIRDRALRFPHSVAFTPLTNHLVVTNAGANCFSVFAPVKERRSWAGAALLHQVVGDDAHFQQVNTANKMEGGPKGIAIHGDTIAVCSPEFGVKLYRFRESPALADQPVAAVSARRVTA